jgi:hypothetical protein
MLRDGDRDAWGAVVLTVSVACTGAPLSVTGVEEQTGGGVALVAIVQLKVTVPLKPTDGVTVVVKVAELPAVTLIEAGFGDDSEKLPCTVMLTDVFWLTEAELPVIVRL